MDKEGTKGSIKINKNWREMEIMTIRQIILITDGHSNQGENPVEVAYEASAWGITVNTIGLLHEGKLGEQGHQEIEKIAKAGEGVWDVVEARELSQSVQLVSRCSLNQTMEKLVSKQLNKVMGGKSIANLPPEKRGKVWELIEELGEKAYLQCVILLDCSGSMQQKLELAKESVIDLLLSLQSRRGGGEVALLVFPGDIGQVSVAAEFTREVRFLENCLKKLKGSGGTPTGPALRKAVELFQASAGKEEMMII